MLVFTRAFVAESGFRAEQPGRYMLFVPMVGSRKPGPLQQVLLV